jgi:hypothetical protein
VDVESHCHDRDSFVSEALTTDFIVAATIRRCNDNGISAYLAKRGEGERGTLLVKINRLGPGCDVWMQICLPEGKPGWMQALQGATVPETEADDYIRRATARDPDLWVVEIEDPAGINPFEGQV